MSINYFWFFLFQLLTPNMFSIKDFASPNFIYIKANFLKLWANIYGCCATITGDSDLWAKSLEIEKSPGLSAESTLSVVGAAGVSLEETVDGASVDFWTKFYEILS